MFKGISIFILSLIMSFNIIAMGSTSYHGDIKSYIGKSIKEIGKDIQKLHEEKKIKIISEEQNRVTDIFVRDKDIDVDGIRVGDSIESIYKIYPEDWIYEDEKGIVILKGKNTHYGIATEYIIFLTQDRKNISEIQLGYTSSFTHQSLSESNLEAKNLLQGKWESKYGKTIEFNERKVKDNQFDELYISQEYVIISPNEMIIYRNSVSKKDKIKLRFWVTGDELYIFSVNSLGLPIRDTVEKFNRIN